MCARNFYPTSSYSTNAVLVHQQVVGAYLTRYLDSRGASLKNPEELFNAMVEGVPARTFVEVMEVDQDVTTRVRGVKGMVESYSLPKEFTERQERGWEWCVGGEKPWRVKCSSGCVNCDASHQCTCRAK